jgi:hypothetical protein
MRHPTLFILGLAMTLTAQAKTADYTKACPSISDASILGDITKPGEDACYITVMCRTEDGKGYSYGFPIYAIVAELKNTERTSVGVTNMDDQFEHQEDADHAARFLGNVLQGVPDAEFSQDLLKGTGKACKELRAGEKSEAQRTLVDMIKTSKEGQ